MTSSIRFLINEASQMAQTRINELVSWGYMKKEGEVFTTPDETSFKAIIAQLPYSAKVSRLEEI